MKPQQQAYQKVLTETGKSLGLRGRIEEGTVIAYCLEQINAMVEKSGTAVSSLTQLRDIVAAQLNLTIREIRAPEDIKTLLEDFPSTKEPVMARIPRELDDQTDAIVVHRPNCEPWERPYLAVINCMGDHFYKRYFSKWHEIVHLLLEGRQMTFAFRRTHEAEKQQPLEQLVDRVAGHLAFYSPLFKPVFHEAVSSTGLTFDAINYIRAKIAPEASRQATILACVRHSPNPVLYARLGMSLKKTERAMLAEPDFFPETKVVPEPKLRILDSASNEAAQKVGLQMFRNMSISDDSLAARAFKTGGSIEGQEDFALWRDDVPLKQVAIQAVKIGSDVHCLLHVQ